jgi:hypothetical protein
MLESQNIKANIPVTIGKRQIDGKSHFTVNGQTATELLQGGGAPQGGFAPQPNVPPMVQPSPVPTNAPVNVGTPQQPQQAGVAELKVHLESALKLVNSLNVNVNEPIITPGNDELPF